MLNCNEGDACPQFPCASLGSVSSSSEREEREREGFYRESIRLGKERGGSTDGESEVSTDVLRGWR